MNTSDKKDNQQYLDDFFNAIEKEQVARQSFAPGNKYPGLSGDNLERAILAGETRSNFTYGIKKCFELYDRKLRGPMALLCLPAILAQDYSFFGSNALLHAIISETASPERHEISRAFAYALIDDKVRHLPVSSYIEISNKRMSLYNMPTFTLGECYWLFQLSQHMRLTTKEFSDQVYSAIWVYNTFPDIDFTQPLDSNHPRQLELTKATIEQYNNMFQALQRLY